MKARWKMLQLNPHLPGWNTYFIDLIRILKTAKKDGRKKEARGEKGMVRKQKRWRRVGV